MSDMTTHEPLTPYEQWMVRSNLETIRSTSVTVGEQAALLRANGYHRIAAAVEEVETPTGGLKMLTLRIGPGGDITPEDFDRLVQVVADANSAAGLQDAQLQRIETLLDSTLMAAENEQSEANDGHCPNCHSSRFVRGVCGDCGYDADNDPAPWDGTTQGRP